MSKKPKYAYAVTRGCYSDYTVLCITDSKERALEIIEAYNRDKGAMSYSEAELGSFPLVSGPPKKIRTYRLYSVVWDDGQVEDGEMDSQVEWEFDMLYPEHNQPVGWRWVRAPMYHGKGGRLEVYGTDPERVRKVSGDLKAALLADDALRARQSGKGRG